MLSPATMSAWGKSDQREGTRDWMPLWLHLLDTSRVAAHLASKWLAPSINDIVENEFKESSSGLEPRLEFSLFCSWVAGIHDIGKLTPAFASKVEFLYRKMLDSGLKKEEIEPAERFLLPHAMAGQITVEKWLKTKHAAQRKSASAIASIVGAHHGVPPDKGVAQKRSALYSQLLGNEGWEAARFELLSFIEERLEISDLLKEWGNRSWSQTFLVLVSGLVIISDWIASTEEYFRLLHEDEPVDIFMNPQGHKKRVFKGISRVSFPTPWEPKDQGCEPDSFINQRFDLPKGSSATHAQKKAVLAARTMELPGLLIIQDSTGAGKTEAALLAAEIMAARTGRSGVLFALPTQATTDAMFSRQLDWLERVVSTEKSAENSRLFSVQLQHGRALLNEKATELRRKGYKGRERLLGELDLAEEGKGVGELLQPCDVANDEKEISILPWFSGRKKSILADFVTTTIDHVLMAALCAPHLMLRHLGIARKVVVIDEVHSYSSYMNSFLDEVLTWLGAYGVPVVLLSATLSEKRSAALTNAYRRGIFSAEKKEFSEVVENLRTPFPCMIQANKGGVKVEEFPAGRSSQVKIKLLRNSQSVESLLIDLLSDGGCALIVRNTVRRAQQTFEELQKYFGECVSLHHARFTLVDRQRKDEWLLEKFGSPRNSSSRPERAIVVATQVVEQSLDVDFDVLITDLSPIDLIIQRMGRLHRHTRERPPKLQQPACFVDWVPSPKDSEPSFEKGAESIYGLPDMLRTAATINQIISTSGTFTTPQDVHEAIESVYGEKTPLPDSWRSVLNEAEKAEAIKKQQSHNGALQHLLRSPGGSSLNGWLHSSAGDGEKAEAKVREGDESLEVVLLRKSSDGNLYTNDDVDFRSALSVRDKPERNVARAIMMSSVRLPRIFSKGERCDRAIEELEKNYFDAWQSDSLLKGQLFLILDEEGKASLADRTLKYDSQLGLQEV